MTKPSNRRSFDHQPHRVGLFGGTFDPPTYAHLIAAEWAWQQLNLEQVWFLLNKINPLKAGQTITEAAIRVQMLKDSISDCPHFQLETCELQRPGVSYTYDTIIQLKERHPELHFIFLAGADIVKQIHYWHRSAELLEQVEFAVFNRGGYELREEDQKIIPQMRQVIIPMLEISSTLVRDRVRSGKSIRFLTPDGVCRLIQKHSLYLKCDPADVVSAEE